MAEAANTTPPRGPGRPSKGDRRLLKTRVPEEHVAVYEKERQKLGLDWTDWIAYKLATAEGLELPDYLRNVVPLKQRETGTEGGAVAV
ncbi:hypothetical protein ABH924_003352 [Arthrobacter sp. GAS37]|uniref:hypothetical protein n=1 Tax=Arthrobacter sp. GAS37 TaxID=3156261 RepID=UPI0038328059